MSADVGSFVSLASAAFADGNQPALFAALRALEEEICKRRCDIVALKEQRRFLMSKMPPEAEDELTPMTWLPINFVRGVVLGDGIGRCERVFVPDLATRPQWAEHCTQMTDQGHGLENACVQDRFFGAAKHSCIWCVRNALLDGAKVNALQETGWNTWDHVHYDMELYRASSNLNDAEDRVKMLEYLEDAGATSSTSYRRRSANE